MKLYLIKNTQYNDKKVAAENMEQALSKYRDYLSDNIFSVDYSSEDVFENVIECKYLGEYEDIIK